MINRYEVTVHLLAHDSMRAALASWQYAEIVKAKNSVAATEIFLESDNFKAALKKTSGINTSLVRSGLVIKATALGEASEG